MSMAQLLFKLTRANPYWMGLPSHFASPIILKFCQLIVPRLNKKDQHLKQFREKKWRGQGVTKVENSVISYPILTYSTSLERYSVLITQYIGDFRFQLRTWQKQCSNEKRRTRTWSSFLPWKIYAGAEPQTV